MRKRAPKIGKNLRRIIDEKELTINAAARLCGIDWSHMNQLVHDKRSPSLDILVRLMEGLDVRLVDITGLKHLDGIEQKMELPVTASKKELAILDKYRKLPAGHWMKKAIDEVLLAGGSVQKDVTKKQAKGKRE